MEYIVSENQFSKLILENSNESFSDYLKEMYSFAKTIVQKVKRKYSLNAKLLLTWGASLGGLVLPLNQFIQKGDFELDEFQTALILVGVGAALFYENKRYFDRIYEEIKKEGLGEKFKVVLLKGIELRNSFIKFVRSLRAGLSTISEIISYGFLVPIFSDILNFLQTGDFEKNLDLIVKRIIASGVSLVVPEILREILKKISQRISK